MSTTTLAAPIRVNHSGVHARPGLARLVAVELRKTVNTPAGLWLQITMVALTAAVVIARRVFGEGGDHTFAGVLDVGLQPAAVLLPITGILLVTSEWSQRTGMITFALVPVRSRVLGAKLIASIVLSLATIATGVMSEILVGALEPAAASLGMTRIFVGVILVALVGNAAEHSTAVLVARKNHMDLAFGIAVGSSLQIAMFVAPVLVFASYLFGAPLNLIFTPFEVVAVGLSVLVVGFVAMDGESHWMEGVMLVGVYIILAIAFFFLPG